MHVGRVLQRREKRLDGRSVVTQRQTGAGSGVMVVSTCTRGAFLYLSWLHFRPRRAASLFPDTSSTKVKGSAVVVELVIASSLSRSPRNALVS